MTEVAVLRSGRLVLDAPVDADIDVIVSHCQDPLFERYLTTPWPYRREHAEGFVREIIPGAWADESEFTWAIRRADGGPLLGVIGWRARGDVGFWMGAPHRGEGLMTEALGLVVEWVFTERGAEVVMWEAVLGNIGSARVARAVGFTYAGVAPTTDPHRDGTRPDGWRAVLRAGDPREARPGWPL